MREKVEKEEPPIAIRKERIPMNYNKKTVKDVDVKGKKVLLRCDFNDLCWQPLPRPLHVPWLDTDLQGSSSPARTWCLDWLSFAWLYRLRPFS